MSTVLVIDVEKEIVDILESFLSEKGLTVRKAYAGKGGLDLIRDEEPVDLIILDDKMPGMSGEVFREKVRDMGKDIPVIVLTGAVTLGELDISKKKKYKHLLYKPVRLAELGKMVKKVLLAGKKKPDRSGT